MSSGLLGKGGMAISDGSWTLTVFVTDLQVERSLRVRGDLHIGGVMIRLVDDLGKRAEYVTTIYFFWNLPPNMFSPSDADGLVLSVVKGPGHHMVVAEWIWVCYIVYKYSSEIRGLYLKKWSSEWNLPYIFLEYLRKSPLSSIFIPFWPRSLFSLLNIPLSTEYADYRRGIH